MTGTLQPLDNKFAIVDRNGNPTDYFIRWAQQKQIDIGSSITLTDLANYLAAHPLIAGTGIQLTPDGNIADGVNIHADVQAILDEITATRGAVLYRGLLGWAALLPDTAGKVLSTNGAGADPSWITPAASGGGAWTEIATQTLAANAASISFSTIASTYKDLIIVGVARSNIAGNQDVVRCQFNADTAANYDFERENRFGVVDGFATTYMEAAIIAGSTSPAGAADSFEITLTNYSATVFHKTLRAYCENMQNAAANGFYRSTSSGRWKNTAAINQVTLFSPASQFIIGSVFTLYGRQ